METTDEESGSTGHSETTTDSRKGLVTYGFHPVTVSLSRSASPLLSLGSGSYTVTDNNNNNALTVNDS